MKNYLVMGLLVVTAVGLVAAYLTDRELAEEREQRKQERPTP